MKKRVMVLAAIMAAAMLTACSDDPAVAAQEIVDAAGSAAGSAIEAASQVDLNQLNETASEMAQTATGIVSNVTDQVTAENLQQIGDAASGALGEVASNVDLQQIGDAASGALGAAGEAVSGAAEQVGNVDLQQIGDAASDALGNAAGAVGDYVSNLDFSGSWQGDVSTSTSMAINKAEDGTYQIRISVGRSATDQAVWEIQNADLASGRLNYSNANYYTITTSPDGTQVTSDAVNTTGSIVWDGAKLVWEDAMNSAQQIFTKQ